LPGKERSETKKDATNVEIFNGRTACGRVAGQQSHFRRKLARPALTERCYSFSDVLQHSQWGARMKGKKQDRLAELCSQALSETDPHELIALFSEINDILSKHILHVQEILEQQEARERLLHDPPYLM
jgi:hypothetical protein